MVVKRIAVIIPQKPALLHWRKIVQGDAKKPSEISGAILRIFEIPARFGIFWRPLKASKKGALLHRRKIGQSGPSNPGEINGRFFGFSPKSA